MMRKFILPVVLILLLSLTACEVSDGQSSFSPAPSSTVATSAPGDFSLDSIIGGAEKHMAPLVFTEIPQDELGVLYPTVVALPVEVRGRRSTEGLEYLVIATKSKEDISTLPDIGKTLNAASAARAAILNMGGTYTAGGFNKYAAIVVSNSDEIDLMSILSRTFTGEYLFN